MEELARLADMTRERWQDTPQLLNLIDLCLEEMVSNTIKYGHQGVAGHAIDVWVAQTDAELVIEIRDDAPFFDAFGSLPAPALDQPLAERPIGGLGVHLVRSMMDESSMRRVGTHNVTRLVKHLARPAP
jgi:anti-sigma regulatory factor (Ser/Thr protein kinase)